MRSINCLVVFLSVFSFFACNSSDKTGVANTSIGDSPKADSIISVESHHAVVKKDSIILVPLEIVKESETDPFKKYGFEFSGNCYACDVAEFHIYPKTFHLVNACDSLNRTIFGLDSAIFKVDHGLTFRNEDFEFDLKKIIHGPIYELKVKGNISSSENLRIVKFYTLKDSLAKFEVHDCGDFQG